VTQQAFKLLLKSLPSCASDSALLTALRVWKNYLYLLTYFTFSALTLLVGRLEEHLACKKRQLTYLRNREKTNKVHEKITFLLVTLPNIHRFQIYFHSETQQ